MPPMSGGLVKQEFMMLKHLGVVAAAVTAFGVSAAQAGDLVDGKKGLGIASAIGGPTGLAFNYGTGNLAIEGILGVTYIAPDGGDAAKTINFGAGAHFMALRAEKAALSAGGRLALGMGDVAGESITQFGLDIPVRVYWFADEHFSLHFETGISVVMVPEKGAIYGGAAGPKGMEIGIVNAAPLSNVGATFWW
jgi:hypothetical protein